MKRLAERLRRGVVIVGAFAIIAASAQGAAASTIGITSPAGLLDDGHLDWGVLGSSFSTVSNGFTTPVPGVAGLTLTGTTATTGDMARIDEGDWVGSFAPGEPLLWSLFNGPLTFSFDHAIAGFGAQIAADAFGPYTARIEAFDASHGSLGFFTSSGVATPVNDDSALFLGILSSSRDIRSVSIGLTVSNGDLGDFALASPVLQADPVPEPASLLLLGTGLLTATVRARRRRQ